MANNGKTVVIVNGARTPFGNFGGALRDVSAIDLGVAASKAAMNRSRVDAAKIDQVIFGNVMQTSADGIYGARHVGLKSGCRIETPALTVNRLCGSGLQAIISGAEQILLGQATYVLAGGMENMSQAPHIIRGARWGFSLGQGKLEDSLWEGLTDSYNNMPMAITAENLARQYEISREASDELALHSQHKAVRAAKDGYFAQEIAPVEVAGKKGPVVVDADEGPRPDTSAEEQAKRDGLEPLGRLIAWSAVGVDPDIMGIGPAFAIPQALQRAELDLNRMDVVEINEAFAPQVLACVDELDIDRSRLNPNGGAISLGHPLGASGARLAYTTLHELRRAGKKYGVASACIGGGQGIAAVLEAL